MKKKNAHQTAIILQQVKEQLRCQGKSVRQFCKEQDIDVQAAYDLLNGRTAGHTGKAHAAAVALGIKPRPEESISTLTSALGPSLPQGGPSFPA